MGLVLRRLALLPTRPYGSLLGEKSFWDAYILNMRQDGAEESLGSEQQLMNEALELRLQLPHHPPLSPFSSLRQQSPKRVGLGHVLWSPSSRFGTRR